MKKTLIFITIMSVILSISIPASAATPSIEANHQNDEIIYFDDGSYLVTSFVETIDEVKYSAKSSTFIRTGTKKAEYYSNDNELLWIYTLTGEFNVNNGVSVICTNATASQTINSSSWGFYDENTYIENQIAHGEGLFKKKILFVTTKTVEIDLFIVCDTFGNLS